MSDNSDSFVVSFAILTIAGLQRLGQAAQKITLLLRTGHACIIILYYAPSDHDRMRPTRNNSMRVARSSNSGATVLIGIVLKWDIAMDTDSDVHTIKRFLPNLHGLLAFGPQLDRHSGGSFRASAADAASAVFNLVQ